MQGIKPAIGYNGQYGFRRNTPWLRQSPSPFGTASRSPAHEITVVPRATGKTVQAKWTSFIVDLFDLYRNFLTFYQIFRMFSSIWSQLSYFSFFFIKTEKKHFLPFPLALWKVLKNCYSPKWIKNYSVKMDLCSVYVFCLHVYGIIYSRRGSLYIFFFKRVCLFNVLSFIYIAF